MKRPCRTRMPSPLGPLVIQLDAADRLTRIAFGETANLAADIETDDHRCAAARRQLEEYFAGHRRCFDLECAPSGTDFQRRAWLALARIPYGATISYASQAAWLGAPGAARAVGAANGRNPVPIVVPCHRVVGSNGRLTGYAGGLAGKRWLLDHERRHAVPLGTGVS
jgi:methylated-DNA-[protein]-cysteine S-methyltransferase